MFLHLSVFLFMGGAVWQLADSPGRHPPPPPSRTSTPPPKRPLQWMVRILLECILVKILFIEFVFIHPEVFARKSLLHIVTEFLLFLDITGNLTCLQIKGKDFIKMCQTTDTIAVNNLTLSFVNFTLKKVNKTL